MNFNLRPITSLVILSALLSGCASMKLPDMDFIKFPEFREEAENIPDYPNVADAAEKPKNLRSGEAWDLAADVMIEKRDGFMAPELVDPKSDTEIMREIQDLGNKVDAYKKDDPQ